MQTMMNGYRGLSLLMVLNSDRFFSAATILVALLAGGYLGSLLTPY